MSSTMKFMSWKWIVKKDDFAHWYKKTEEATQEVCAPAFATQPGTSTDPEASGSGTQACDPCPAYLRFGNKDPEAQVPVEPAVPIEENVQIGQDEQHILNHLRSNPSMVDHSALSVTSTEMGKDQGSTGSKTQLESVDGDENEDEEDDKKRKYSKRFLWFSLFAVSLTILLIALVAALIVDRRRAFRMKQGMDNGAVVNATVNGTTLIESDSGNLIYTAEGQLDGTLSNAEKGNAGKMDAGKADAGKAGDKKDEIHKFDYTANSDYLVGTYYYPWYGEDFHRGEDYVRKNLIPQQQPVLGEYDDTNPEVIEQHMRWFRQANIGLLVTSWWGPYSREDNTTKDVIMEHEDVGNLKIALHFETKGRIENYTDMSMIRGDIQHMCENYFDHDNYYSIDGRPVLVVHITRSLFAEGFLEEAILTMRSEASKCDQNLYVIGDQVFRDAPNPEDEYKPFWYFDAVTNFDLYGGSGSPAGFVGAEGVNSYYEEQAQWKEMALKENCQFIPPVSPGYNDRGARLDDDHPAMSRRLTPNAEEGSLFWYQLKQALPLVSEEVDKLILVNSFNEFHEDTQIEPIMSAVPAGVATTRPPFLTGGLEYAAYGELYLDLLGAATSKNPDEKDFFDDLYLFA